MQDHTHKFPTLADAKAYTIAGNATITLQSAKTGVHFTFKVRAAKDGDLHFVSLLSGQDNENDYQYLGIIRDGRFARTAKSRISADAPSFKAFNWFWNIQHNGDQGNLIVLRPNKCGRCARTLTHPESVISGIGPECQSKMGGDL
jgi:Family of unknown function (DUF6011)